MLTTRQIRRIGRKAKLPRDACKHTPSQEEIAVRCAEIRAEWTEAEERRRGRGIYARDLQVMPHRFSEELEVE